jgi:hypothetical protein
MTDVLPPCARQQDLIKVVQGYLLELSSLAREEAEILKSKDETRWLEVDKRIEQTLGDKERAMGALRQHRIEHGC